MQHYPHQRAFESIQFDFGEITSYPKQILAWKQFTLSGTSVRMYDEKNIEKSLLLIRRMNCQCYK